LQAATLIADPNAQCIAIELGLDIDPAGAIFVSVRVHDGVGHRL
jgi:hypothetical protein